MPATYLDIFDGKRLSSTSANRMRGDHGKGHTKERESENIAIPVLSGFGYQGKSPAGFCDPNEIKWRREGNSLPL